MDTSEPISVRGEGVAQESTLEKFLQSIEKKAVNPVHQRLLEACRQANQRTALETELRAIVAEILNEA